MKNRCHQSKAGFVEPKASWDLGLLDSSGIELSGGDYSRVNTSFQQGNWGMAGLNTVANMAPISWTAATGAWTTAYQLGIYDHATGKLLQASPLTNPVSVSAGDTAQFGSNALSLFVPI
jgi:hypothetical protein